jgi:glycosyltransferase involved in cell wall biosynthesis
MSTSMTSQTSQLPGQRRLSVVISNYNYATYVGHAIDSALRIQWPDVEVIVVDDGSTDGSRQVIEAFGDRITAIFQTNSGQRKATNLGFARSTGDRIIFLDSDDMVDPTIAQEADQVWTARTSKVQFQMDRIDKNGDPIGSRFPIYDPPLTPQKVKTWAINLNGYPTPPGSGNLYARAYLERMFPVDDSCGDAPDSILVTAAPFLGDVHTVDKPLIKYRIHGENDSNILSKPGLFAREVARAQAKFEFSQRIGESVGIVIPNDNFRKSLHVMQHRIPSITLDPDLHPIKGDSKVRVFTDMVRSTATFEAMSLKRRIVLFVWGSMTLLAPKPVARKLIRLRFRG